MILDLFFYLPSSRVIRRKGESDMLSRFDGDGGLPCLFSKGGNHPTTVLGAHLKQPPRQCFGDFPNQHLTSVTP